MLRDAVAAGALTADEYAGMTVPTWNRTMAEFTAPSGPAPRRPRPGLDLLEQSLVEVPDAYLSVYRETGDADSFAQSVSAFLSFTEPSLIETLDRTPEHRAAIADRVYADVRGRLAAEPERFETVWRVVLLRIVRAALSDHLATLRALSVDRLNRRLLIATGLSFLVLLFAPLFFWAVEHGKSAEVHSVGDAYGWLARTLFENTSPYKLKTQFGFVSYWIIRVAGVSLVAFATATIASGASSRPSSDKEPGWGRSRGRTTC